jgi:hypothetical protein
VLLLYRPRSRNDSAAVEATQRRGVRTLRRYGIVVDAVGVGGVVREQDNSDMDLPVDLVRAESDKSPEDIEADELVDSGRHVEDDVEKLVDGDALLRSPAVFCPPTIMAGSGILLAQVG